MTALEKVQGHSVTIFQQCVPGQLVNLFLYHRCALAILSRMKLLSECDNGDEKLLVGVKEDGRIKKLWRKVGESLLAARILFTADRNGAGHNATSEE